MKNLKTNDDLIKELLSPDEQAELHTSVEKEVSKHWGGLRKGAGRKPKDKDKLLCFNIRVSLEEKIFLQYARKHNLDYSQLMET